MFGFGAGPIRGGPERGRGENIVETHCAGLTMVSIRPGEPSLKGDIMRGRNCLLLALLLFSGCGKSPVSDANDANDTTYAEIKQKVWGIAGGGYTTRRDGMPPDQTDVLNLQLTCANYEASQRVVKAVERFDRSSDRLGTKMIWLSVVMVVLSILTLIMTCLQVAPKVITLYRSIQERPAPQPDVGAITKTRPKSSSSGRQPREKKSKKPKTK